jgi:hypothetical protein
MSGIALKHPTEIPTDTAETQRIPADYQTPEQLAAELGLRPITLKNWRARQKGPPYAVVCRKIFYHRSSTREWIASQTRTPGPATRAREVGVSPKLFLHDLSEKPSQK